MPEDSCLKRGPDSSEQLSGEGTQEEEPSTVDPLVEKVFGPRKYDYRLSLEE